jgi:hypothetical protein
MPDNTEKAIIGELSDKDYAKIAIKLDDLGITDKIESIYRVSGRLLSYAVDFMKDLGLLSEFVQTLPLLDGEVFVEMYKARPKMYGGNPFD